MTWPHPASPFHPGERMIQRRLGVRERVEEGGRRLIRDFLRDEHRDFYAGLPFLVLGSIDAEGWPSVSIAYGKPGFASSPHAKALVISIDSRSAMPAVKVLATGVDVGILGIDLATRRRNRLNGIVSAIREDTIEVTIVQAYDKCTKYIAVREWFEAPPSPTTFVCESNSLGDLEQAIVTAADTFFIASALGRARDDPSYGVDASHRGGAPGFVRIDDARTLTVPDFIGNFAFNTLGNLLLEPRCGLLFLDFATGTTVEIAAEAEILWGGPEVVAIDGAQRLLRFHLRYVRRSEGAVPLRWTLAAVQSDSASTTR
ncbi:MAG TPA: pyridoxamine 5'-phosphate oxidase family protein [Stellaceae bacterium]|nr:pyridoxamine 5'-phosphate oxidase family protein [Stellaceae bacterium]